MKQKKAILFIKLYQSLVKNGVCDYHTYMMIMILHNNLIIYILY